MVNKKVNIEANVEINIALIIFSGLTLYAEHITIEVAPHGPTLTNKAPAKFIGFDKLKNVYPKIIKISGDIISFNIEIVIVNLLKTFFE